MWRITTHLAKPFNIKSSHYTNCSMWQQVLWMLTREVPWTHIDNTKEFYTIVNTKEFSTCNASLVFGNLTKGQPHADWQDKIQGLHEAKKTMSTYKQSLFVLWKNMSCCSWMSKKTWTACSLYHLCYQSTIRGVEKRTCLISIRIAKLDLNASCNENGHSLSSNPTSCFLVPVIIKCNKFMTTKAQTLLNYCTLACFMDKELVQKYKWALVEKNTQVLLRSLMVKAFHQDQSHMKPNH